MIAPSSGLLVLLGCHLGVEWAMLLTRPGTTPRLVAWWLACCTGAILPWLALGALPRWIARTFR